MPTFEADMGARPDDLEVLPCGKLFALHCYYSTEQNHIIDGRELIVTMRGFSSLDCNG